jgi:hypothetical protein
MKAPAAFQGRRLGSAVDQYLRGATGRFFIIFLLSLAEGSGDAAEALVTVPKNYLSAGHVAFEQSDRGLMNIAYKRIMQRGNK